MFVSEFACPCCGTVIQPTKRISVGRPVQCFACRTTFVVSAGSQAAPPPEPATPATLLSAYPTETVRVVRTDERETGYRPIGRHFRRGGQGPNIGLIAFLITGSITLIMIMVLGGVLAYRHLRHAGLTANQGRRGSSNPARLVGLWQKKRSNRWTGWTTLEFSSGGRFRGVSETIDNATQLERNGTWEIVSENGNQVHVQTITSHQNGVTSTFMLKFVFIDDNTMTYLDDLDKGPDFYWHRR